VLNNFPLLRQPTQMGCLPTCVRAVLRFHGEPISYDDASEYCRELPQGGCDWADAVDGLRAAGYEVHEFTDGSETPDEALRLLRDVVVHEGLPVIVRLQLDLRAGHNHAVVVIGFEGDIDNASRESRIIYMDPAHGRIDDKPTTQFLQEWDIMSLTAMTVS
jgi:hypothetical protein